MIFITHYWSKSVSISSKDLFVGFAQHCWQRCWSEIQGNQGVWCRTGQSQMDRKMASGLLLESFLLPQAFYAELHRPMIVFFRWAGCGRWHQNLHDVRPDWSMPEIESSQAKPWFTMLSFPNADVTALDKNPVPQGPAKSQGRPDWA